MKNRRNRYFLLICIALGGMPTQMHGWWLTEKIASFFSTKYEEYPIPTIAATAALVGASLYCLYKLHDYLTSPKQYFYGHTVKNNQPVTIFAHGLNQNKNTGYDYSHRETESMKKNSVTSDYEYRIDMCRHKNGFIESPLVTFNFDYHDAFYKKSALGQEADIETLHAVCRNYIIVDAVGVSCGAATLFNYLASYQPKNIRSAVLEATFSTPQDILKNLTKIRFKMNHSCTIEISGLQSIASLMNIPLSNINSIFPNFDEDGIVPIKLADKMPKEIPILLVCSKEDDITKSEHSSQLYEKMKSAGHNKVYLLNLEFGEHAGILESQDGQTYRNVVHAFYRHHGRPYNQEWAHAGQQRFEQCPGFIKQTE